MEEVAVGFPNGSRVPSEGSAMGHSWKNRFMKKLRHWGFAGGLAFLTATGVLRTVADTQTLSLSPGWNLIAFQVTPVDPSPSAVFGALGGAFDRAFSFDTAAGTWSTYGTVPAAGETANLPPLPAIAPGKAFWVYMKQAVPAWIVTGTNAGPNPPVNFSPGWNMIGVPVGAAALPEKVNILSVLTAAGLNFTTVLRWEQGLYAKFDPTGASVDDFTAFDPSRGYWVNVKGSSTFSLQPILLASTRADQDVAPYGNYPSYEDMVVSDSATPLGSTNQTTIRFFPGEESQTLALGNVGGGILLWQASTTNAPWLRLSATQGVTTLENDVITLSLDRKIMLPGRYETTLTLHTTAGDRAWRVVADVAPLAGDWRGTAIITSVNGRKNPVPDIDLHIAFFEDPATPGLLRGMIDSQNALLWPVDVPLAGHRDDGNNITLGGGFILPPGDVNRAPYSQFNPSMEDIDWNCNGKFDAINPYPFPICRQVSMQASLVSANSTDGYKISGQYFESVYGMMREPIQLVGEFTLYRENPTPFAARRPIANVESPTGTDAVILKQPGAHTVPTGTTTFSIPVATDLALASLSVSLDVSGMDSTNARISLQPPVGPALVLVDHAAIPSLAGLSFPNVLKPRSSFDAFLATAPTTRGTWKLIIENSGGAGGTAANVSLTLAGQPVFTVAGQVQGPAGSSTNIIGLPAQVFLDGLPYDAATVAGTDGSFKFTRVPGIPLNISASLAGYAAPNPAAPGLSPAFTTPQYDTNCLNAAGVALASRFRPLPVTPVPQGLVPGFTGQSGGTNSFALQMAFVGSPYVVRDAGFVGTPFTGPAPLPVDFTVIAAGPYDNKTPLRYTYGDGSAPEMIASLYASHTYANSSATGYTASMSVDVAPGQTFSLPTQVYPMPSPGNSPYALNFFSVAFTGGGSLPANEAAAITGINDTNAPPSLATLLQVQICYAAGFDLDLAPQTAVGQRFDSDGFDPMNTIVDPANITGNFRGINYAYSVPDGTDPGSWSLSSQCGAVIPSDTYRGYPRAGATGDCAGPRFAMTCNIGPMILPATADEVYTIDAGRGPIFPSSPDPLASPSAGGIAGNEDLRLITGPLAGFWKEGNN